MNALDDHAPELRAEFAVPRLDCDSCRKVFLSLEDAEEEARERGGVIEERLVTHWRVIA